MAIPVTTTNSDDPASAAIGPSPLDAAGGEPLAPSGLPPVQGIGAKVGGGMTWMAISAVLTRVATFVAQILMGWWLDPAAFALYGTATAISGFLMVCRDMGTGYILVQRGQEAYEENAGPAFWLGFTFNSITFAATALLAFPLAEHVYHARELAPMLIVMGLAVPLGAISNVLYSRLRLDLRFKAFSAVTTASGFVRQISMIALAWWGFGPMSFAWPVLIYTLCDCLLLWILTRDSVWLRRPNTRAWAGWMRDAVWLMATSLANFAIDWGPYLVLGPILGASNPIIGYYFFAYQITAQIGMVLAFNSTVVLTPALQRLNNDTPRQAAAALRALRSLMLAGSVASLGLAAIMGPLEHLLWNGKYATSVGAIVILGALYPWRITFGLTSSLLTARGEFVRLAVISVAEAAVLMLAALCAGYIHPTAAGIACWTGGWMMLTRIVATIYIFARLGTPAGDVVRAIFPAWFTCVAGLGAALLLAAATSPHAALTRLVAPLLASLDTPSLDTPSLADRLAPKAANLVEIIIYGTLCSVVMLGIARVALRPVVLDMLAVAPARLRVPLAKALRL